MIPSTAQATLTNILLSGVPTYGHTAPSPPPGLTPVDVHINSMQSEGKKISASLNGHAQVRSFAGALPFLRDKPLLICLNFHLQ